MCERILHSRPEATPEYMPIRRFLWWLRLGDGWMDRGKLIEGEYVFTHPDCGGYIHIAVKNGEGAEYCLKCFKRFDRQ